MSVRTSDYFYDLPAELIAQTPLPSRAASRLLVLDPLHGVAHRQFVDLPKLLRAGDLLVLNDTRVIPARINATKDSGGRVEVLVERIESAHVALCHVRASKSLKADRRLTFQDGSCARMVERADDLYRLEFAIPVLDVLHTLGEVPLPPYIERRPEPSDAERYQTVYAQVPGAVAAPTAGLHFDTATLRALESAGVATACVTLHVGAGTFQPVRSDDLTTHHLHSERVSVCAHTIEAIDSARRGGGRVIAVGTTVVRALEAAALGGALAPLSGDTDLFIRPGFRFRVVDAMITNFHLPRSTLLVLVSAFAGRQRVLDAYLTAVLERYRFFSYGDAMFIPERGAPDAL